MSIKSKSKLYFHYFKDKLVQLESLLGKIDYIKDTSQLVGVSKVGLLVVAALSIALLFCIVKNIHADLIITVLGTVIPAYESMKAADSGKREDLVHWLSYWCCFSLISLSEVNKKAILHVLPYYYLFKFILVFYLSSPNFKGAYTVYHNLFKPLLLHLHHYLKSHHSGLDELVPHPKEASASSNTGGEKDLSMKKSASSSSISSVSSAASLVNGGLFGGWRHHSKKSISGGGGGGGGGLETSVKSIHPRPPPRRSTSFQNITVH